jgi:hypothetical protein
MRCGIDAYWFGAHRLFSHSISTYAYPSLPWSSIFWPTLSPFAIPFCFAYPIQSKSTPLNHASISTYIASRPVSNLRIRTYLLYIPQFRIAWLFLQGDLRALVYTCVPPPFAGGGGWEARLCLRLPMTETCLACLQNSALAYPLHNIFLSVPPRTPMVSVS